MCEYYIPNVFLKANLGIVTIIMQDLDLQSTFQLLIVTWKLVKSWSRCKYSKKLIQHYPLIHTYHIVRRNSKYQPFLQMSELPVLRCGTVGSNTAW